MRVEFSGEERGLLARTTNHAVRDDVGVFVHLEHGANTVEFELLDARGEAVPWRALQRDSPERMPPDSPARLALRDLAETLRRVRTAAAERATALEVAQAAYSARAAAAVALANGRLDLNGSRPLVWPGAS